LRALGVAIDVLADGRAKSEDFESRGNHQIR
jgi:hypothetical protein